MYNLHELLDVCNKAYDGSATETELKEAINIAIGVFTHINDFVETIGYDWEAYPYEFFMRSPSAAQAAIETFSDILNEVDDYINDNRSML